MVKEREAPGCTASFHSGAKSVAAAALPAVESATLDPANAGVCKDSGGASAAVGDVARPVSETAGTPSRRPMCAGIAVTVQSSSITTTAAAASFWRSVTGASTTWKVSKKSPSLTSMGSTSVTEDVAPGEVSAMAAEVAAPRPGVVGAAAPGNPANASVRASRGTAPSSEGCFCISTAEPEHRAQRRDRLRPGRGPGSLSNSREQRSKTNQKTLKMNDSIHKC